MWMDALRSVVHAQQESSPTVSGVPKSPSASEALSPPVAAVAANTSVSDSTDNVKAVATNTDADNATNDVKIPLGKKSESADSEDKPDPKHELASGDNAGDIPAAESVDTVNNDGAAAVKKVLALISAVAFAIPVARSSVSRPVLFSPCCDLFLLC